MKLKFGPTFDMANRKHVWLVQRQMHKEIAGETYFRYEADAQAAADTLHQEHAAELKAAKDNSVRRRPSRFEGGPRQVIT